MRLCIGLALLFIGSVYAAADLHASSKQGVSDNDNNIKWLTDISHTVRNTYYVDITLPRESFEEDCYMLEDGQLVSADSLELSGVKMQDATNYVSCKVTIGPMTENLARTWALCGKSVSNAEVRCQRAVITLDSENPSPDDIEREIIYLDHRLTIVNLNNRHQIAYGINREPLVTHEECLLITPDGRQYAFIDLIDGINVPQVEVIDRSENIDCGIIITVLDESPLGNWTIIDRGTSTDPTRHIERRLPITIRAEANIVLHNDIYIRRLSDLYIHMNNVNETETCVLYGPDGEEFRNYESDTIRQNTCGYIVRNVNLAHNGTWMIRHGNINRVTGRVDVIVLDSDREVFNSLQWSVGDKIDMTLGPADAVYCILRGPRSNLLYEDFGQCRLNLERVTTDDAGFWTINIGKPGTVRLQSYFFRVSVRTLDNRPVVTTTVEEIYPTIMLTCSVPIENEIYGCEFRDSRFTNLIAAPGVGQGGYMFNGTVSSYVSGSDSHDCTLRIINASIWDMGIWRCGLDTSTGKHYGFLTVVSPRVIENSEDTATIVTDPNLESNFRSSVIEGEPMTLSCYIRAPIRYCYFRADNGTIYNVFPRMPPNNDFEYVGAGLDAGECGIRFKRFSSDNTYIWSCHVGVMNDTELRTRVFAFVDAPMRVRHYWGILKTVVVEGRLFKRGPLDYCRFVKSNGEGLISYNLPERYEMSPMTDGNCILHIHNPDSTDLQPWTVVAKPTNDGEISRTTTDVLNAPGMSVGEIFFWIMIAIICSVPVILLMCFISKKNRDRFRRSWSKTFARNQPTQVQHHPSQVQHHPIQVQHHPYQPHT